jgi:hypothetical protein
VELKKTFSELVETHGKNNEKNYQRGGSMIKKHIQCSMVLSWGLDVKGMSEALTLSSALFVGVIGRTWWCSKPNSGHQK